MENKKEVNINLSLHPDVENRVSKITKEYYEQELENLEPIKEGEVNIHTSYVYDNGSIIEASIIIRNGLDSKINFEYLPVVIVDEADNIYFRGTFDGKDIGDIEPFKARPYKLYIKNEDLFNKEILGKKLFVKFDYERLKAEVDDPNVMDVIFANNMNDDEKRAVLEFISAMPPLEINTIDLDIFQKAVSNDKQKVYLTYVVRNASSQDVKLDYLPYNHESGGYVQQLKLEWDDIVIPKRSIRVFKVELIEKK